jgi:chromosome segregation ATPase
MERKVARAQGERSQEETNRLKQEIEAAQKDLDNQIKRLSMLTASNKQLIDEKRNIEREINKVKDHRGILET